MSLQNRVDLGVLVPREDADVLLLDAAREQTRYRRAVKIVERHFARHACGDRALLPGRSESVGCPRPALARLADRPYVEPLFLEQRTQHRGLPLRQYLTDPHQYAVTMTTFGALCQITSDVLEASTGSRVEYRKHQNEGDVKRRRPIVVRLWAQYSDRVLAWGTLYTQANRFGHYQHQLFDSVTRRRSHCAGSSRISAEPLARPISRCRVVMRHLSLIKARENIALQAGHLVMTCLVDGAGQQIVPMDAGLANLIYPRHRPGNLAEVLLVTVVRLQTGTFTMAAFPSCAVWCWVSRNTGSAISRPDT